MSSPYLSEIRMFAFNFAPKDWSMCNGQTLAINQYTALFSLIGTTYGGNGVTTFLLPNLRGNVPLHFGTGGGQILTMGQTGGEPNHTLTLQEMPQHTHPVKANSAATTATAVAGTSVPGSGNLNAYAATPNTNMNPAIVGNNGSSQPHSNMQPYLVVNFCIAMQGIFPSRN